MENYLRRPHGNLRQLFVNRQAGASAIAPLLMDLGTPAGGMLWSVQQVCIGAVDPFTSPISPASGANPSSTYGTVTTPALNAAIVSSPVIPPGTYQVTVQAWYGGVADAADNMYLAYQSAPATFPTIRLNVPPVVNGTPVPRTFVITTGGGNSQISVQAQTAGAAGSVYKATIDVVPLTSAANVNGAIILGSIGGSNQFGVDLSSVSAGALPVPGQYQAGGKSIIARSQQHLYVALAGLGLTSVASYFCTATVLEVPDTAEALLWL